MKQGFTETEGELLLVRPREFAAKTGYSLPSIYRWLRRGIIPSVTVGRTTRIPASAIPAWLSLHAGGTIR